MDKIKLLANDPMWDQQGPTKNLYRFPLPSDTESLLAGRKLASGIPDGQIYQIGNFVAAQSPESHIGPYKWAVDLLIPDGTPVLAGEDGKIVNVVEVYNTWGPTEEFRDQLNYLTISHKGGEYSQYCHLAPNSVSENGLKVGDKVVKGQRIASVGKTGWTDRDHLHFIVFRTDKLLGNPFGFYSLEIRFDSEK